MFTALKLGDFQMEIVIILFGLIIAGFGSMCINIARRQARVKIGMTLIVTGLVILVIHFAVLTKGTRTLTSIDPDDYEGRLGNYPTIDQWIEQEKQRKPPQNEDR